MLVSEAIESLKKFNHDETIFMTYMHRKEFQDEFDNWNAEAGTPCVLLTDEEWNYVVEGTQNDDRIAEAIYESMKFDFNKIVEERQKHKEQSTEQQLWEE